MPGPVTLTTPKKLEPQDAIQIAIVVSLITGIVVLGGIAFFIIPLRPR